MKKRKRKRNGNFSKILFCEDLGIRCLITQNNDHTSDTAACEQSHPICAICRDCNISLAAYEQFQDNPYTLIPDFIHQGYMSYHIIPTEEDSSLLLKCLGFSCMSFYQLPGTSKIYSLSRRPSISDYIGKGRHIEIGSSDAPPSDRSTSVACPLSHCRHHVISCP